MTSRALALAAVQASDEFTASRLRSLAQAEYARELLRACTDCDLASTRTNPVPWSGWPSPIMLVGEAPGRDEDKAGEPFVGRSGQLLRTLASEAGLTHSANTASASTTPGPTYSLANTIGCRPPDNNYDEAVKADAPARCRVHLRRALEASQCWVVVAVGRKAQNALRAPGRDEWSWVDGRLMSSIFHPAYLLRLGTGQEGRAARDEVVRTLRWAGQAVSVERHLPEFNRWDLPEASHVGIDWGASSTSAAKTRVKGQRELFTRHWRKHGWVAVWSPVIGERVVVRSEGASVPDEYNGLGWYTPDELAKLRGDREMLRRVHAVKVAFGGKVMA